LEFAGFLPIFLLRKTAKSPFRPSNQASTYLIPVSLKGRDVSFCSLLKDTTSEVAGLSSHYPFLMLNIKQGSCDYQPFKSDSTWESNQDLPTARWTL